MEYIRRIYKHTTVSALPAVETYLFAYFCVIRLTLLLFFYNSYYCKMPSELQLSSTIANVHAVVIVDNDDQADDQWRHWGTTPGDTLQGVTPEGKKLWANLQRIVDKRGRTGKKSAG